MTIKKGDVVKVVEKIDIGVWVREMDKFVNNGKHYHVAESEDDEGDVLVDCDGDGWYFPAQSLQVVVYTKDQTENQHKTPNPYLDRVSINTREVKTYTYEGCYEEFSNRGQLLKHIYNTIMLEFPNNSIGVTPESIDLQIVKLQKLKELCQNLK